MPKGPECSCDLFDERNDPSMRRILNDEHDLWNIYPNMETYLMAFLILKKSTVVQPGYDRVSQRFIPALSSSTMYNGRQACHDLSNLNESSQDFNTQSSSMRTAH